MGGGPFELIQASCTGAKGYRRGARSFTQVKISGNQGMRLVLQALAVCAHYTCTGSWYAYVAPTHSMKHLLHMCIVQQADGFVSQVYKTWERGT